MDELNASKRRKIEDTVLQILKASDLETTTEFSVRSAVAGRLGFELSGLSHRRLVRQLVDSFLLSTAADILRTSSLHGINSDINTDENADNQTKQRLEQQPSDIGGELKRNCHGRVICKLSDKRRVTIHDMNGTTKVAIRDFYMKDKKMLPRKGVNTGISLTATEWSSFRSSFPSIQEAILKLESRLRSVSVPKQSESDVTDLMADSSTDKIQAESIISNVRRFSFPPIKRKQIGTEANIRNSAADSSEKSQTQASIVAPHMKSRQTKDDTSNIVIASNPQEHILVERKQAAAGASEPIATSNYQEQIPASRNETKSDIPTLVPPFPTQRQLGTVTAVSSENLIPAERKQTEADISTLVPLVPSQGHFHYTANAIRPERLIPIQTTRFDGRNYHSWRHQMEFSLNQLNIKYVLSELCPSVSLNPEANSEERDKVNAAIQRWINDDCMCRHNILNSLCDNLYQLYSKKNYSARVLWEELKSVYDDDFGTKRSQINKYINFQMVDGVSILEQVQELHQIADSVIASGTWIEESFHASVIVSKLPSSWKELRGRLMHEDFLPLHILMQRLRVEEDSRNFYKKVSDSKKDHARDNLKLDSRPGTRRVENKRVCYSCGKEGHIAKNCPDKISENCDNKSFGKENEFASQCTDTNIVGADKTA